MIARREWTKPAPYAMPGRLVGNVMGHRLTLELDDAVIRAELQRFGIWPRVADEVRLGRSWLVAYPTDDGLSIFLWLGKPGDSGFAHYHLAGVAPVCAATQELLTSLRRIMQTVDREEYFQKDDPQANAGQGC